MDVGNLRHTVECVLEGHRREKSAESPVSGIGHGANLDQIRDRFGKAEPERGKDEYAAPVGRWCFRGYR